MILKINGDINKYYVQTLCMVFFPGATFGENEQPGIDVPEVSVDVYRDSENKNVISYVSIKLNDKLCEVLGIKYATPFGNAGEEIGRIGTLDGFETAEELAARSDGFGFDRLQFIFAIHVFEELGLVSFDDGRLTVYRGVKVDLADSTLYARVARLQQD